MDATTRQKKSGIPLIGLGTYKLEGQVCIDTVKAALKIGYRHLDTADVYNNHREIAEAIRGFDRSQLFITSKLFTEDLTEARVAVAVARFLKELEIERLDLLLIHWPNPAVPLEETLEAMIRCQEKGMINALGVSNFVRFHLDQMQPYITKIATNQVEMHPFFQRKKLQEAYEKAGIELTAYRCIGRGALAESEELKAIGHPYGKSATQVALRWLIQRGVTAIPKASSTKHLKENFDVFDFELSDEDLGAIARLESGKRYCAPANLPVYDD